MKIIAFVGAAVASAQKVEVAFFGEAM